MHGRKKMGLEVLAKWKRGFLFSCRRRQGVNTVNFLSSSNRKERRDYRVSNMVKRDNKTRQITEISPSLACFSLLKIDFSVPLVYIFYKLKIHWKKPQNFSRDQSWGICQLCFSALLFPRWGVSYVRFPGSFPPCPRGDLLSMAVLSLRTSECEVTEFLFW